jgi:hypothetical protein
VPISLSYTTPGAETHEWLFLCGSLGVDEPLARAACGLAMLCCSPPALLKTETPKRVHRERRGTQRAPSSRVERTCHRDRLSVLTIDEPHGGGCGTREAPLLTLSLSLSLSRAGAEGATGRCAGARAGGGGGEGRRGGGEF